MARPPDWSALGLGGDPTPGDAPRLERVAASQLELVELAKTIDSGISEVMNTTNGVFVGKTADALREIVDGRLRNYISTFKKAHEDVRTAMITYVGVMQEQQRRADTALTAAAALAEDDDAGREAHRTTAEDAKEILEGAASTFEAVLTEASESIASPVDECEEFWKALTWIAIILIIPAIIVGGPLALISIALNVALMIKAAVDFAQGHGSVTALVLGILGVIAPTTKGLNLGNLWKGIKGLSGRGFTAGRNLFLGGPNAFGLWMRMGLGLDDAFKATGAWINGSLKNLRIAPGLVGIKNAGLGGGNWARGISLFPIGAELTVINLMGARTFFGLRSVITGLNGIRSFGSWVANGLSGFKGLRLFLPVAADEMGQGLALAFRIGFIDRGIFGMYRYGAFANGKFIGAGAKISGVTGAGTSAFGPAGSAGFGALSDAGLGGLRAQGFNFSDGTLIGPMDFGRFTPHVNLGGFGSTPSVGPIGLGTAGSGLGALPNTQLSFNLGSFAMNLPTINMPSLTVFLGEGGGLAGVFRVPGTNAQITDLPVLGFPAVDMAKLGDMTSFTPQGSMNFDLSGLGSIPQAVGHVSIPNLSASGANLTPAMAQLPDVNAQIADLHSTINLSMPQAPALGHIGATELPTVSGGELGTIAHADLGGVDVRPVDLPAANGLTMSGMNGIGHVSLPNLNVGLTPNVTPQVGATHVTGLNTSPSMDLNIRPGPTNSLQTGNLSELPNVNASLVDLPALGHVDLTSAPTTNGINGAFVNIPELGAAPIAPVVHAHTANGSPVGDLGANGRPGGGSLSDLGALPVFANRNFTVFMMNGISYNLHHTFDAIPGLHGVQVSVTPSRVPNQVIDINVTAGSGAGGVQASYVDLNGMDVLRVEQALPNGGIHRWDYHLSAEHGHPLLNEQIIDTHVTGPNPGQSVELTELGTSSHSGNLTPGASTSALPNPTTGTTRTGQPPPPYAFDVPGLQGARVEVRFGDGGGFDGLRSVGGAGSPQIRVESVTGPGGIDLIRVERTVSQNVEVRRWDFAVDNGSHQLVNIERRFNLTGGHFDGTAIRFDVNLNDTLVGPVRHVDRDGGALNTAGGAPIHVDNTRITIPSADGFRVYDPATGGPTHNGLRLFGADGNGLDVFVLTPHGGGAPTLVDSAGTAPRGTVATHPGAAPGSANVFHVRQTGAAPTVSVYSAQGAFSHTALPVVGANVPGGFIRLPDAHGMPQLAHADGTVVPNTHVTDQPGNGYRVQHPGGHVAVDNLGNHTHDVTTLTGGTIANRHVFTPANTPNTPLAHPRADNGLPDNALTVNHVAGTLHVTTPGHGPLVSVYSAQGAFSHTALPVVGANVPGGFIRLPDAHGMPQLAHADGTVVPNTHVTDQPGNGYRVQHPGGLVAPHSPSGHLVVDNLGNHTHNVTTLTGGNTADQHIHTPVGGPPGGAPAAPLPHPRGGDGTPDPNVTVARVGNDLHVTDADNTVHVHGPDGAHRFDAVPVRNSPLAGVHFIRTDAHGTTLVTQTFGNVHGARVTTLTGLPGGGYRVEHGAQHIALGPHGDFTHTVVALRGANRNANGQLVFTPHAAGAPNAGAAAGAAPPSVHGPDGTPSPSTVVTRADGSFDVTNPTSVNRHGADGAFAFTTVRLADATGARLAEGIRVHPGGAHELFDGNLARIGGATVAPRPGGGFRVGEANGGFRLFDAHGNLAFTVRPGQIHQHGTAVSVFHVSDNAGVHLYDTVRLSDSAGFSDAAHIRHVEITPGNLQMRDGNLVPVAGGGQIVELPNGAGYRVNAPGGLRQGEFRRYDASGRIEFQRINIVHEGAVLTNRHFEVRYPAAGAGTPTWRVARFDAAGTAVPAPAVEHWFDGGTVGASGAGSGRVHLTSHSGSTVFERRPLPGGNLLDAHHDPSTVGGFGYFNQRGVWTEFNPNGTLARYGRRNWGESTRAYFDVTTINGLDRRVRHFQMNPDGGHVLTPLHNLPLTQSFGSGTWYRFNADFRQIATGTRNWGPGRGWTDEMAHPVSGDPLRVHEKFGRFQFNVHNVRRYQALDFGRDGMPGPGYTSVTPEGKVNGSGSTLENGGGFVDVRRFAEQRPPVFFRRGMSGDIRSTDMSAAPWFGRDNRLQVAAWHSTPVAGPSTHGVQFTNMVKSTFDFNSTGNLVREVRTLPSGNKLKVGDVRLPDGANPRNNYLPFSEGAGNPRGHRTFAPGDFVAPPGTNVNRIIWQDRVNTNLGDADWFSPGPGRNWHVVRTGLDDGSVIDYRPTPAVRPDGAAGDGGAQFRQNWHAGNGDWSRYDHQGNLIGRQDTWPNPATGGVMRIEQHGTPGSRDLTWRDLSNPHISGRRITNFNREITPWGFDRESFQDFGFDGRMIRDHRVLSNGTHVDAWRVSRDANGVEVWQWNKIDRHGNIMDFGTGGADRIRHWFDGDNNLLTRWEPGARWSDDVASMNHMSVQQIPPRPGTGAIRTFFSDAPWRIREFAANPGTAINPHIWREFDNGAVVHDKIRLGNGTFLERSHWNDHWRQYGPDGVTVMTDRSIAGFVSDVGPTGTTTIVGRETNFVDALNEYRGFGRMGREANRWKWGPSVNGAATEAPFTGKALQALAVEFGQEWLIDFVMNLVVFGIVAAVTGTPFTGMDVLRAMFGATMSAGVKSGLSAGHLLAKRGGPWKLKAGNADDGKPSAYRPDDHNWNNEWGGMERVQRWRAGTYDFGVNVLGGSLSAFLNGAAGSAIFGIKDKNGNTVKLSGTDALLAGLGYALGGMLGGLSVGAARTLVQNNLAGRWFHRQGPADIFILGSLGKLADKSFSNLFMNFQVLNWTIPDIRNGPPTTNPPPNGGGP